MYVHVCMHTSVCVNVWYGYVVFLLVLCGVCTCECMQTWVHINVLNVYACEHTTICMCGYWYTSVDQHVVNNSSLLFNSDRNNLIDVL